MPTYLLPNSSGRQPVFSARLGGGVGVVAISPSNTFASSVISISPTRVTTSSVTESRAVPVVLSLWVYVSVSPSNFPVSPVVSLISATIELSLPWWFNNFPKTLMYQINASLLCPCTCACEHVQDLMQSPFESNSRQISLISAAKGMQRFS